jgi:16S rRNA (uracil1498-N3)-methyltransferase
MKRFFAAEVSGSTVLLNAEEAQHCIKVMRCRTGERIELMNGKGLLYKGIINILGKLDAEIAQLEILRQADENPNKLSIAISPTKNPARLEWFVEKATEIGIANIYPVIAERTEKTTLKTERLRNIIISAAKQSGQLHFPEIHPIQSLQDLIEKNVPAFSHKFIAHCTEHRTYFNSVYPVHESALLLIGPEGDFTSEEIAVAFNKNYIPVSLGNSILRVETAGIVACSIVSAINSQQSAS